MKKGNQLVQRGTHLDNSDVTTWALSNGAIARFGRGYVHDMAFSPDEKYLAVGSRIGLWWYRLSDLSPIALWETDRGLVSAIAFSDDGQLLVTGNWDGDIKVWDVQQANILVRLKIPALTDRKIPVKQVTLSPDKHYLAASGSEDVVYVWSLETGNLIAKFTGTGKKDQVDGQLLFHSPFHRTVNCSHPRILTATSQYGMWRKMKKLLTSRDIQTG